MNRAEPRSEESLLALASALAVSVGRGRARGLSRLAGGRNNQVYRVDTDVGAPIVLKRYFADPRDVRDRLRAEWDFLKRAWGCGVRAVPEPLGCDAAAHAGLYSFVAGRRLLASELEPVHIEAAIDFVLAVNTPPRAPLAPASEACFTLADHMSTVERRVARLATIDPDAPRAKEAQSFVTAKLLPAWAAVQSRLSADARAAGLSMQEALNLEACCLSPSDFGFHNALVDDQGRVSFLDFEYAGRDDPAKLVCDFFCQPEVPVPLGYSASFIARLSDGLGLEEAAQTRCRLLLDVYRIKWACIILNEFLPLGAARRAFADAGTWAARCASQLSKAEAKLVGLAP